jgi:PAS domain S-box-containing protein
MARAKSSSAVTGKPQGQKKKNLPERKKTGISGLAGDAVKHAEAALRRSETRLRLAQEAAKAGTWEWDLRTNENFWSEELFKLYGLEPHSCEPSYEAWRETIHPEDRLDTERAVKEAASRGTELNTEWRVRASDGTERWLMSRGRPVSDEEGRAVSFVGIVMDITERKGAEQALRESEEHYRSLFGNMLNGYAYCRMLFEQGRPKDFVYLDVNSAFEALTGLKDVTGKRVSEVIPGIQESDPELLEIYERVALTGTPERFETFVGALGMWFSISVYSPKKEFFVAIFDVITERKAAEKALQNSLEEKVVLLREVHHRVKNNLQIIASLLNLQASRTRDRQVVDVLQETRSRVHSMAILHEVLYRSGNLARINFATYVDELCTHLVRSFRAPSGMVSVENRVSRISLPMEHSVPCGLIINELVTNALKHAFPDNRSGRISVHLNLVEENMLLLSVSDDGIGFPLGIDLSAISTLGLRLVSNLAAQLGGRLAIEGLEPGSLFSVTFPVPENILSEGGS